MLAIGRTIKETNKIGNLNISGIFSELIQAAGMGCEAFASDLFYDLSAIYSAIQFAEEKVFYIGIRTSGVDGESFMRSRLNRNSCSYEPNCYLKLYRLSVSVENEEMTVLLERINEYEAKRELVKE